MRPLAASGTYYTTKKESSRVWSTLQPPSLLVPIESSPPTMGHSNVWNSIRRATVRGPGFGSGDTGKTMMDASLGERMTTCEKITWLLAEGEKWLKPEYRTNLMKLRSDYKDAFVEKHGVKLGLMSGFVKATVSAVQHQPVVNAVIDGEDIIYRDYIDIGIAVGMPKK